MAGEWRHPGLLAVVLVVGTEGAWLAPLPGPRITRTRAVNSAEICDQPNHSLTKQCGGYVIARH